MMTLSGGAMPMDQYQAVDGRKAALQLLQGGNGTVTPFGVAYDNGMELKPVSNGSRQRAGCRNTAPDWSRR